MLQQYKTSIFIDKITVVYINQTVHKPVKPCAQRFEFDTTRIRLLLQMFMFLKWSKSVHIWFTSLGDYPREIVEYLKEKLLEKQT